MTSHLLQMLADARLFLQLVLHYLPLLAGQLDLLFDAFLLLDLLQDKHKGELNQMFSIKQSTAPDTVSHNAMCLFHFQCD